MLPGNTLAAISPSGSPFTYVNADKQNCRTVLVYGGTVSAITRTEEGVAVSVGFTNGEVSLFPGQAMVVTYSSAPTMAVASGPLVFA